MEIKIKAKEEDKRAVAKAIEELNSLQHVRYMSRSMITNTSLVKDTKLRVVLQDMLDDGELTQYQATQNPRLQRYYYVLTEKGRKLLEPAPPPT